LTLNVDAGTAVTKIDRWSAAAAGEEVRSRLAANFGLATATSYFARAANIHMIES
jgi:hypothetical protein